MVLEGQRCSLPNLQNTHSPQVMSGFKITFFHFESPDSIVPLTSCPKIKGASRLESLP